MVAYDLYRVRIRDRVSSELAEICQLIEKRSPQNAVLVATEILSAIDSLEIFPHRHPKYEEAAPSSLVVRKMPVLSFLLYYTVYEADRVVDVLSLVHGSRIQPTRFD